jgi:ATP-binding cassette subfamily C protein
MGITDLSELASLEPPSFAAYTSSVPDNLRLRLRLLRRSPLSSKITTKGARAPADSSMVRSYVGPLAHLASWKLAFVSLLTVCVTLTEGVGLLLLIPLLQVVGLDMGRSTVGRISGFITSIFDAVGARPTLLLVLGLYVLVISARSLASSWQTVVSTAVAHEFKVHLRQRLYRAIVNTDWLFFSRSRSSDFTHALTSELDRVGRATRQLLRLIAEVGVAAVYVLVAVFLSPPVSALAFVSAAGLMLLLRGKMQATRAGMKEASRATKGLYSVANEQLSGTKTIKSFGAEERNVAIFSRLTERIARLYIDASRHGAAASLWLNIGMVLVLSLIVYISIEILATPASQLLLLLYLFAMITRMLTRVQMHYHEFIVESPALTTVTEMEARCKAAAEPEPARSEDIELREAARLEGVSFAYQDSGEPLVISDLDLTIPAGKTTAIVGPSGAGKSTIADLVMGLIQPDEGRVVVDETPLRPEQRRAWRSKIGYVPQDTFLFHDTVRENLLWARPEARDEEIREALRLAAAEDFVSRLPEGIETVLGDRGVRLSGGERQRLALARALLRKPSLLILDEATSNLDSENERRIQSAIEELHGSMTILIITHRLFTTRSADVIYVLEQGRSVESGDLDTLVARKQGRFLELCNAQSIDTVTLVGR